MTEWTDGENKSYALSVRFDVYQDGAGWAYACRIGFITIDGKTTSEAEARRLCWKSLESYACSQSLDEVPTTAQTPA